jgi:hypothetical protein
MKMEIENQPSQKTQNPDKKIDRIFKYPTIVGGIVARTLISLIASLSCFYILKIFYPKPSSAFMLVFIIILSIIFTPFLSKVRIGEYLMQKYKMLLINIFKQSGYDIDK